MKKFYSFVLAFAFILTGAICLTGCDGNSSAKVMNVGLNPKLEFVLDKNDKVLSVNALNDDGNHIISLSINDVQQASEFIGLTAEEAVEMFLDLTEDNGYLITGNEEEIKIEISGDANKLLNKVKEKANEFFTNNGLDIDVITENIEKSEIMAEVKKCMKEFSDAELNNMTQEQLIDLLKESRAETQNLLTQELKDAYYNMRAEQINIAEVEALFDLVDDLAGSANVLFSTFENNMNTLLSKVSELETAFTEQFFSEDSVFGLAKKAYIDAKEALLAKRLELAEDGISATEQAILETFETTVENAKNALESAKVTAQQAIGVARSAIQSSLNLINSFIDQIKNLLNTLGVNLENLNNAKEQAIADFKTQFQLPENFGDYVGFDKSQWGNN